MADFELKFTECYSCRSQPGTPVLCSSCLANRQELVDGSRELRRLELQVAELDKELGERKIRAAL